MAGSGCHSRHPAQGKVAARQTNAGVTATSDKELTVVTAEGDTVNISVSQTLEADFTDYRLQSRIPGQRFALESRETSRSASVEASVTVEGDLNAEELADIHKLIRTLNKVADSPQHSRSHQRLHSLSNLDTIASASFQLQETFEWDVSHSLAQARNTG